MGTLIVGKARHRSRWWMWLSAGAMLISSSLYLYADVTQKPLWMHISVGIAAVTSMVWIPTLRPGVAVLSGLMLMLGAILMASQGMPVDVAVSSMTANLPLASLITIAPIVLVPLTAGGYMNSIHHVSRRLMQRPEGLVSSALASAFFLGSVFNISALRLVMAFVDPTWVRMYRRPLTVGLARGFCAAILWSPYFAAVGLVLQFTRVPFGLFSGAALGAAALWLVFAYVWGQREQVKPENLPHDAPRAILQQADSEPPGRSLTGMVVMVLIMFVHIVILDLFAPWELLTSVSLVILTFSLLWLVIVTRTSGLIQALLRQYVPNIYFARNEIVLFLIAGFFGKVLSQTAVREWLLAVGGWMSHMWVFFICVFIMGFISLLSIVGIHQAVSTMLILSTWEPDLIGLTPLGMALLLIGSWAVSTSVSPVTPVNLILSEMAKENPVRTGLAWNWRFATLMGLMFCSYVSVVDSAVRWFQ